MFPKTSFALRGVRRALLCLTTLMLAMVSASGALAHSVAEGFARHAFAANVVLMSARSGKAKPATGRTRCR
jgi:hypothetical protein